MPVSEELVISSLDTTKLRLRKPTPTDAGRYRVVAKNKYGESDAFITLRIVGKYSSPNYCRDCIKPVDIITVCRFFIIKPICEDLASYTAT